MKIRISDDKIPYEEALTYMETRIAEIRAGGEEEIWLLEHPPLITSGTSAKPDDLLDTRFPVYVAGRGGQYTYHGPGQRIVYVMVDLNKRKLDIRTFVKTLEQWIINSLAALNIKGEVKEGRIGVWVTRGMREDKIAALGLRVRHGITWHGISFNIEPDLSHFNVINPCGITNPLYGVTSLHDLGHLVSTPEIDIILRDEFLKLFGTA
jgi:lipoyl(octanoyl) transferase